MKEDEFVRVGSVANGHMRTHELPIFFERRILPVSAAPRGRILVVTFFGLRMSMGGHLHFDLGHGLSWNWISTGGILNDMTQRDLFNGRRSTIESLACRSSSNE